MRYFQVFLLAAFSFFSSGCGAEKGSAESISRSLSGTANVKVWLSTPEGKRLAAQKNLAFTVGNVDPNVPSILIDDSRKSQYIDGFGATMTDSSAWVISQLPPDKRNDLMNKLFHKELGIGLNFIRVPIGSTDFARGSYTYDDTPGNQDDPNLLFFSMARDKTYLIPLLKMAKQLNPQLKFMLTPWSAPAWMKDSRSIYGGRLREDSFDDYAAYLAKVIQSYAAEGLPIQSLSLINEPEHAWEGIPSMHLSAEDAVRLVADHLGPLFEKRGIKTKIVVWDHNWYSRYPLEVLQNAAARKFIFGSAFHCYGGSVTSQSQVHKAFPEKAILFTECSGTATHSNFGFNLQWGVDNIIVKTLRNYSRTGMFWNLALDENHGPKNGRGCGNCTGVVTVPSDGSVKYNSEYYALGHASKFTVPGAYRVESSSSQGDPFNHVALVNPDGSHVLILVNTQYRALDIRIRWKDKSLAYSLPAWGVATMKW